MEVKGKVALITGSSTGIGLATARLFSKNGAKIGLVARSADILQQLVSELPDSFAVSADLSEIDGISDVVDQIISHFGGVDILINNAGRAFHAPIEKADAQLYRKLLDLNVVSVMRLMQCVIPTMRKQGSGVIVNVSSGLTKRLVPGTGPYSATKYALNALTLIAREELASDHISVGVMYPGRTENTKFRENAVVHIMRSQSTPPAGIRPPGRADTPQEVAEKILEAVQSEAAETFTASTQGRA